MIRIGLLALLFFAVSATSPATAKDILAKVGDQTITLTDFNTRLASLPKQYQTMFSSREAKVKLLNQMVDEILIKQVALDKGMDKSEAFKDELESQKTRILVALVLHDAVEKKVKVTDSDVKAYYNSHADEFGPSERRHVKHILVKNEKDAQALLKSLQKGKSFEDLAKTKSVDPSSANGGDLGWFTKGQFVPEFEKAAFNLKKKGDITGVVHTSFGFHIIKLVDTTATPKRTLTEAQDQIRQSLLLAKQKSTLDAFLSDLRGKSKITKEISLLK